MDKVAFVVRREHHSPTGYWSVLEVHVNGVRLQVLVHAALEPTPSVSDTLDVDTGFMGLDPEAASSGHFLGQPVVMSIQGRPNANRVLLRCSCGELQCDSVAAEICVDPNRVTWRGFQAGGAPVDVGPFEFDRAQYNEALRTARNAPDA